MKPVEAQGYKHATLNATDCRSISTKKNLKHLLLELIFKSRRWVPLLYALASKIRRKIENTNCLNGNGILTLRPQVLFAYHATLKREPKKT